MDSTDFYKEVVEIINKYNIKGSDINIEITESLALVEDDVTLMNIKNLSSQGIGLAMDDFGVGHSSLIYLTNMSFNKIKIDGSLSRDIVNNEINSNIVSNIYDLCRLMDLEIVVEYVETQEQLEKILEIGKFLIQGYFVSPPINGIEVEEFARRLNKPVSSDFDQFLYNDYGG